MIIANEVKAYLDYYQKNKRLFNKERILLIENIVKPLLKRNDVFFDEETYRKCIEYCEKNYYPLFPYQKFVYAFVFMYVDESPLFRTILVVMGRGNGKDGFMMPLMNFLQTPFYGVKNYNIDIIANNEEQSKDSFNVVYDMLEDHAKLKSKFRVTREEIVNKTTKSRLRYNTSNAKTKDGKKGGALLFNELHAYEDNSQIDVFKSQLGKIPHPRIFIITTNGYVRGGPLDEMLRVSRVEVLEKGDISLGYFPFICCIDDLKEVDDSEMWVKANPSLPFLPVLRKELHDSYKEMKLYPTQRVEFITKRMNLPELKNEIAVTDWNNILYCSYSDIEKLTPRLTPSVEGHSCVIGIDFADIRDFASAGILFKVDDTYIFRQHTWINSNGTFFEQIKFPFKRIGEDEFQDFEIVDSSSLSVDTVVDWCVQQMEKYDVKKIVMDTYRYPIFKEKFEEMGIEEETKKNPYGKVRLMRRANSIYTLLAPLIEKSFADRVIDFGPSAIMRWYTNNTGFKEDNLGNKCFIKIEPKLRKNDGFSAFVAAMFASEELQEKIYYI